MAVLKSSELKYGIPTRVDVGSAYLTATQVETPASAELQAETETLELDSTKLGLVGNQVLGVAGVLPQGLQGEAGSVASTTALPLMAWSTPLKKANVANETKVLATEELLTDTQIID